MKKKNTTRIIAIVLVLLMALALVPIAASAEGTVTWTFQGNGGQTAGGLTEYTKEIQADVDTKIPANEFVRAHFNFTGWHRTSPVEGDFADEGAIHTTAASTLVAQWEPIKVKVSFDGGAYGTGMADVTDLDAGSSYTLPTAWSGTSDAGWRFTGWTQDGSAVSGSITLPDEDVTLVAQWEMDDPVTVSFDANGGSGAPAAITTPRAVAFSIPTEEPTRSGYKFLGWAESSSATAAEYTGGQSVTPPSTGNLTLYAVWAEDRVTIKFAPGIGSAKGSMDNRNILRNDTFYLPSSGFSADKKAFDGWQVDGGSKQAVNDTLKWPAGDYTELTITATWKDLWTVNYFNNDGTTAKRSVSVKAGDPVNAFPSNPSSSGKKFIGWYENPAADPNSDTPVTVPFTPTGDKDLYAGWLSATIPVKFDGNGSSSTMPDGEAERGGKYTLPENSFTAPAAKKFKEWKIDGVSYAPGAEYEVPLTGLEEITVTAQWEDDKMAGTVTLSGDPVVGETLIATANITYPDPAGTVRYQWQVSEDGSSWTNVGTASADNSHAVTPAELDKYLRCVVTCSNKTGSSLESAAKGPVTGDTVTVTISQEDYGTTPGEITLKYNDGTAIKTVTSASDTVEVIKNTPFTVTVKVKDPARVVKTVGGKKVAASYEFNFSADAEVKVVYEDKSSQKTVTVYPSKEPTAESTDPVSFAGKNEAISKMTPKDRALGAAYDIIICYNNNPSDPVTDTAELAKQSFVLRFPSSVKKSNYGKGSFEDAWTYKVFHYDGSSLTEVVSGVTYNTSGSILKATVTGQTSFSPYITAAAPKKLTGKVILSVNGTKIGDSANVAIGQTLHFQEVTGTNAVDTSFHYAWYYGNGTPIAGAVDKDYVVTASDMGKGGIFCRVTHDVQTEYIDSTVHAVAGKPAPSVKQHIINEGDVLRGIITDVTADMEYYRMDVDTTAKPSSSAVWTPITGTTLSNLYFSGNYWIRFKDDTNSSNWASVNVYNYFTVTCRPDSVSGNRLVFSSSNGIPYKSNTWLVKEGGAISITATSSNTTYYKITSVTTSPVSTASKTNQKANAVTISITKAMTYQPYTVYASAGVYGSKTGDYSHLDLWMELAALSMMGLCALVVVGRKKLKKQ